MENGQNSIDQAHMEPIYCVCGQVAFGEMIACDGEHCDRDWFHLRCFGRLVEYGKWLCPDCVKKAENDEKI